MLFKFIIFLIFCWSNPSLATWSKQKNDELKLEVGVIIPRYNFDIKAPKDISSSVAQFEPNAPSKTSIGLTYRNLGASLSTSNPPEKETIANYGESSATDFQFRFFGKRTYEFYYQSYQGYFIKNSSDLDPSYAGIPQKIVRPDLKTQNYGFNFYWNINDEDYSHAVAFDQSGQQKDSAWGVSWLLHYSQSKIEDKENLLIPSAASSDFGILSSIYGIKRETVAGGLGIGGIATWNHFYLTSFIGVGVGSQKADLIINGGNPLSYSTVGSYFTLRASLGYNGEKNVFGLQVISDGVNTPVGKGEITGNQLEVGLFYAYRFGGVNIPPLNGISALLD